MTKKLEFFKEYYENGQLKYQSYYIDGKLDSSFYEYYSNGKIKREGFLKNDTAIGKWRYYDTLGKLTNSEIEKGKHVLEYTSEK